MESSIAQPCRFGIIGINSHEPGRSRHWSPPDECKSLQFNDLTHPLDAPRGFDFPSLGERTRTSQAIERPALAFQGRGGVSSVFFKGVCRVYVAASTRSFSDKSFAEATYLLDELEFDKIELWLDETKDQLKPSEIIRDPDGFCIRYRESTRLTPVALCLDSDIAVEGFAVLTRVAKQLRIAQITLPASRLGTPFNSEIDRLRQFLRIASQDGILVSIKTKTGHLTEDPNTAIELCQAAPGLGLTLDPSYYVCGPHRGGNYDQVFPYVHHMHLRDTTEDQVQVPVGLGIMDYSRLISQLERVKYQRALSIEILPELTDDAARLIELRKMRLLLESLL
jgi:sugar phosphate isomerase/epimerase